MVDQLKLAIFDEAGTTIDFGCMGPAMVFPKVYELEGVKISAEEARGPMGAHKRDHILAISQMPSVQEKWKNAHDGNLSTEKDVDRMFAKFIPLQEACLEEYADLIFGALKTVGYCRSLDMKIGGTTGYLGNMMKINRKAAAIQGYYPDTSVSAQGVVALLEGSKYKYIEVPEMPKGRPEPWMVQLNMMYNRVFGPHKVVKIGDTIPDVLEGINAGVWTIGLALSGNELGLSEEQFKALKGKDVREYVRNEVDPAIRKRAYERMWGAGAHYVVDGIWDVPRKIDEINYQLKLGRGPSRLGPSLDPSLCGRYDHSI